MERAHGWEYVRSKNRGRKEGEAFYALPTPQIANIRNPSDDADFGVEDLSLDFGYDASLSFGQVQLNLRSYNAEDLDMFPSNQPYTEAVAGEVNFQNFGSAEVDFNLFDNEDLYNANIQLPNPAAAELQFSEVRLTPEDDGNDQNPPAQPESTLSLEEDVQLASVRMSRTRTNTRRRGRKQHARIAGKKQCPTCFYSSLIFTNRDR
jgi:hypothetical protein